MLDGAALDQTMRMLIGRDVEIRRESGETAYVKVVRGSIELPIELEQMGSRAQLRVFADHLILGAAGAYRFGEQEILCAYGEDFERASALLRVAAQYPEGIRFDEKQLDAICSQMIAPAMAGVVVRKGQQILAQRMPTPAVPKLYVEESDDGRIVCHARFDYCGTELDVGQEWPHIRHDAALHLLRDSERAAVPDHRMDLVRRAKAGSLCLIGKGNGDLQRELGARLHPAFANALVLIVESELPHAVEIEKGFTNKIRTRMLRAGDRIKLFAAHRDVLLINMNYSQ